VTRYSCEDVLSSADDAIITLRDSDSINDPGSTKRRIWGPCTLKVKRWPDGGIDIEWLEEEEDK
jgi:hypothetical protein